MHTILLIGDMAKPTVKQAVEQAIPLLAAKANVRQDGLDPDSDLTSIAADVAMVFGGDGAMLKAARRLGPNSAPLVGVNLGKLGFLTELDKSELDDGTDCILSDNCQVVEQMMIACRVLRAGQEIGRYRALNDVVVSRGAFSRLVAVRLTIDGQHATTYNCDGLIISTPVGSTAHSLSAGGPIVEPDLAAFVVTPISPHTLSNRPLVVPGERRLVMTIEPGRLPVGLTVDGQVHLELQAGDEVEVCRAEPGLKLAKPGMRNYYTVLREKLGWSGHANYKS